MVASMVGGAWRSLLAVRARVLLLTERAWVSPMAFRAVVSPQLAGVSPTLAGSLPLVPRVLVLGCVDPWSARWRVEL